MEGKIGKSTISGDDDISGIKLEESDIADIPVKDRHLHDLNFITTRTELDDLAHELEAAIALEDDGESLYALVAIAEGYVEADDLRPLYLLAQSYYLEQVSMAARVALSSIPDGVRKAFVLRLPAETVVRDIALEIEEELKEALAISFLLGELSSGIPARIKEATVHLVSSEIQAAINSPALSVVARDSLRSGVSMAYGEVILTAVNTEKTVEAELLINGLRQFLGIQPAGRIAARFLYDHLQSVKKGRLSFDAMVSLEDCLQEILQDYPGLTQKSSSIKPPVGEVAEKEAGYHSCVTRFA